MDWTIRVMIIMPSLGLGDQGRRVETYPYTNMLTGLASPVNKKFAGVTEFLLAIDKDLYLC
jgi:hypothetical protein